MRCTAWAITALLATAAATPLARDVERDSGNERAAASPRWEFALTGYPTVVRGGDNYTSAIVAVDRGPFHLEARYDYESIGARSAFIGWTVSGGETVGWEITPLLGGAWGTTQAFVPGFEATVAWKQFDFYVEAEYVRDNRGRASSYVYAWSELGYRPIESLRIGIAGQRTRIYGGDRDIQRGPFVQVTWSSVTLGGYWFNPGSNSQVFVGLVGVTF